MNLSHDSGRGRPPREGFNRDGIARFEQRQRSQNSTRARVMKAIRELKYHPNLHARSLAGGKSRPLGVIVSNLENPFFFDIYRTIETEAHSRGHDVVMANIDYRPEQLVASIRLMIGRRVAGLAAIVSEMDPALIKELNEARIPAVFYDVGVQKQNITNIRVNYRRGIEKILEYLHSLGHRKLGFIGHHAVLEPINERLRTVKKAVNSLSLTRSTHRSGRGYVGRRPGGGTLPAVHSWRSSASRPSPRSIFPGTEAVISFAAACFRAIRRRSPRTWRS
jgi:DNA-binding LacI/PurR family transcriptional regulator